MSNIRHFEHTAGKYIQKIIGQDRLAFAQSDSNDFYDMLDWLESGGYQGSVISFYDFENGKVYEPFTKKRNVMYSDPVFIDGYYYFLQGDFNTKVMALYRFFPEDKLDIVTTFNTDELNLYNLRIIGSPLWVVSQGCNDHFESYYPERFSFKLTPQESVEFIDGNRVYLDEWVEEGWDEEKDCATDEYKYYDRINIRDRSGKLISTEIGSLYQAPDGTWWVS